MNPRYVQNYRSGGRSPKCKGIRKAKFTHHAKAYETQTCDIIGKIVEGKRDARKSLKARKGIKECNGAVP